MSWDGSTAEIDAGEDRTPQGVAALGSAGYLVADDGGLFPLDTRGLFATDEALYWLTPGDGTGALWTAPLAGLQP